MKHLLSHDGEEALVATMKRMPLVGFDYDGTLAPIAARPGDARIPMPVTQRLRRLTQHVAVAIISGRKVSDLLGRLTFDPAYVVGNHGAEDPAGAQVLDAAAALEGLRYRLQHEGTALEHEGVSIEDKGASIALHYRLARDRDKAVAAIDALTTSLDPELRIFGGKMVVNIVSRLANDKAQAMADLVTRSGAGAAIFVGDDVNDEPVFMRDEPDWLTVRIGREDPSSKAHFFLDSTTEIPLMLDRMLWAIDKAA